MNKKLLILSLCATFLISILSLASAATIVSYCGQNLNSSGSYILNQSIISVSTCLATNSSDVIIDCAGNTISYGTAGTANSIGISALHPAVAQTNLTIKNCILIKTSAGGSGGNGIMLTRFANSTIVNNIIRTNGTSGNKGVYILTGASGNNISRNTIITSGTSTTNYGIYLYTGTSDSIVEYNNITTGKGTATTDNYGIYAADPRANITGNAIYTFGSGDSNFGVYSYTSTSAIIVNNTIFTSGTTGNNRGINVVSSDSNYIANNTINTVGQASPGIYLSASNSPNVINNQINSTADSIYMTSSVLADFTSANISRDNTRYRRNITVYGGGGLTLPCPNNAIIDNPSDGGLKFFGCNNITVKNWYRPNRDTDGLLFVNSDNNTIVNNTLNGGLEALDMVNTAGMCDNNLIANNTFSSYGYLDGYAMHLYGTYNIITGNNLSTSGVTSGNNGIDIQNDFNNITNNIITTGGTSGNYGINLETGAESNLVQNNTITTSGTSGNTGIYFTSTNTKNIVRSNTITATGITSGNLGIRLVTNSDNNLIENNSIYTKGLTSGNNGLDLSSSSNNIFKFNNVYAGYGVGTTDNDAISLVSSKNNTFTNNILSANGTATSITSSSIFLQSNSVNNTFANNIITKSVGNAIELDFLTTYPSGNALRNNSLNNVSGADLFFLDAGINGTSIIDQTVGKYNFTGIGETIIIENTQFGKINFTSLVNGSGSNMSGDIRIAYNFVQVSQLQSGLNRTANINLYGLPTNYYLPMIKRDGLYECNATTIPSCVNFTPLNAGNVSFSVSGWSNYSVVNGTDTTFPAVIIISPENISYATGTVFLNYTASDDRGINNCWYQVDGSPNISLPGCSTATISGLEDGSQHITVYVNDTSGNVNYSTRWFTIASNPPQWSSMGHSVPSSYSNYTASFFNVTWNSANSIASVLFESNFSGVARNYSMQDVGEGVYGFNAIIPAGSFYWKSYANDSSGNVNSTSIRTFSINKSGNPINLYLNNELNINISLVYGALISVNATAIGEINLYRNGLGISNPNIAFLGVGLYNYTAFVSESQNYSYNYSSYFVSVNQSSANLSLFINGEESDGSMIYGEAMNVTASMENGETIKLLRNGELIGENNLVTDSSVLGVGVYNYSVVFDGNENYSAGIKSFIIKINKSQPSLSLMLNGEASDLSIPVYNIVSVEASLISPSTEAELYENEVLIGGGISFNEERNYTSLGDRTWELIFDGNENYTNGSISYSVSVLDANFPQYSNLKRSPSSPASYSPSKVYYFNSTWQDNVGVDEVLFEFNGINYSFNRGEISRNGGEYYINFTGLAVGVYSYKWIANDTSGNLVAAPSQVYTVDKGIAALFLTVSPGNSISYGTTSSVGCSANNVESSPVLTRNTENADNPDYKTLGVGAYNYACTSVATANYTSATVTTTLNVAKAQPNITLKIGDSNSNLIISDAQEIDISAELIAPQNGNITLLINSNNISSGSSPLNFTYYFETSSYIVSALFNGDENYTDGAVYLSVEYYVPPVSGGGGNSGGGGSQVIGNATVGVGVDISNLGDVVFSPGESKSLSASVKNKGGSFLNNCKLVGKGEYSSWISGRANKGLAAGEIVDFVFNLNAPSDVAPGNYNVGVALQCKEGEYEKTFKVTIVQAKLGLKINEIKTQVGMLQISYSLQDLSDSAQSVNLEFALIDEFNVEIIKDSKIVELGKGEVKEENVIMTIPDNLVGEYTLVLNADSEAASVVSREKVLLGSSGATTGFALLSQSGQRIVPIVIIAIIILVAGYFIIRRVFKNRFIEGNEGGVIKIGPKNKKGVMIVDNSIIEHVKRHAESHDVKGKWIHLHVKKDAVETVD